MFSNLTSYSSSTYGWKYFYVVWVCMCYNKSKQALSYFFRLRLLETRTWSWADCRNLMKDDTSLRSAVWHFFWTEPPALCKLIQWKDLQYGSWSSGWSVSLHNSSSSWWDSQTTYWNTHWTMCCRPVIDYCRCTDNCPRGQLPPGQLPWKCHELLKKTPSVYFENKSLIITQKQNGCYQRRILLTLQSESKTEEWRSILTKCHGACSECPRNACLTLTALRWWIARER